MNMTLTANVTTAGHALAGQQLAEQGFTCAIGADDAGGFGMEAVIEVVQQEAPIWEGEAKVVEPEMSLGHGAPCVMTFG